MSTEPQLAVAERLFHLLQHLGMAQAHFAMSPDEFHLHGKENRDVKR